MINMLERIPDVCVCMRKEELEEPVEGSVIVKCFCCETDLWLSPKTALIVAASNGMPTMCLPCTLAVSCMALAMERDG